MKFDKKYIAGKFPFIVGVVIIIGLVILVKLVLTMTVNKEEPLEFKKEIVDGSIEEASAKRGNILSDDKELLSTSMPQYNIYFDFLSGIPELSKDRSDMTRFVKDSLKRDTLIMKKDSLFLAKVDSISVGVAKLCPEMGSEEDVKKHMLEGLKNHTRYYDMFKKHVFDYLEYQELCKLPIFNLKGYDNGLCPDPRNYRHHPFDSLANRTIGTVYAKTDKKNKKQKNVIIPISGIELAYDSLLRGHSGVNHKKHIRSYDVELPVEEAEDGFDVVSTINVTMQDICENALKEKVKEVNADFGICVLMDVKTGDIKAMVNLKKGDDGYYRETQNNALSALMEPGSTFKTASIMVAMDDGFVTMDQTVDDTKGYKMYGDRQMNNDGKHGHGLVDPMAAMRYSSNVGISSFIDKYYHSMPDSFIAGLKRIGIGQPLDLPFVGMGKPVILGPKENKYWSKAVSLPWMAIGYNTQIPPINTVAFYNAIANGGKFVLPRFVSEISHNGETVEKFPVRVLNERICKESTLENVQAMLKDVVNNPKGTGKRVKSKYFYISGKTGTAQVADEKGGYHSGKMQHFVSFCGYYPSDNPKFTCLVAIKTAHSPASGGAVAGPVFKKIAEQIYAKHINTNIKIAVDTVNLSMPLVKPGNLNAAQNVLKMLGLQYSRATMATIWGHVNTDENRLSLEEDRPDMTVIPNLKGMGARDAVYALQMRGMKVKMTGCGQVKEQSVEPGKPTKKGQTVSIKLG